MFYIGLMILFIMVIFNGLTFILIAILMGIVNYISNGYYTILPAIEVLAYIGVCILLTSLSFK
jgi:hypothetical protein